MSREGATLKAIAVLAGLFVAIPTTAASLDKCLPVLGDPGRDWAAFWAQHAPNQPEPICSKNVDKVECLWVFDLADPKAVSFYTLLQEMITHCLDVAWEDTGVNHPDAFRAIGAMNGDFEISASFKRKTALFENRVVFRWTALGAQ